MPLPLQALKSVPHAAKVQTVGCRELERSVEFADQHGETLHTRDSHTQGPRLMDNSIPPLAPCVSCLLTSTGRYLAVGLDSASDMQQ